MHINNKMNHHTSISPKHDPSGTEGLYSTSIRAP